MMMEYLSRIKDAILYPFAFPLLTQERFHIVYLLSSLLIAYLLFRHQGHPAGKETFKKFLSHCFPKSIYRHRSSILDYGYFFAYKFLFFLAIVPFILSSGAVSTALLSWLKQSFGTPGGFYVSNRLWLDVFFTLFYFIIADLSLFITHYASHKIPLLWEFHKVHHSAEVLTPLTVYRMHPLDDVLTLSVGAIMTGSADAFFHYFFPQHPKIVTVMGLNVFFFLYYLLGYNLRHSHIWLSYGPVFSHFLISPAQHQIHHSKDLKHYDKNFGFIFAFWDHWTGSLYIPENKMALELGLSRNESVEYSTVPRLFLLPFKKAAQRIFTASPTPK